MASCKQAFQHKATATLWSPLPEVNSIVSKGKECKSSSLMKRVLFSNRFVQLLGIQNMHRREAAPKTMELEHFGEGKKMPSPTVVLTSCHRQMKCPRVNGDRHHPLELRPPIALGGSGFGCMAGLISRRVLSSQWSRRSPQPWTLSSKLLQELGHEVLLKHRAMTLKPVSEPQGFSLNKQSRH